MEGKYSYKRREKEKWPNCDYAIIYTEEESALLPKKTLIAVSDTAEKADLIVKAITYYADSFEDDDEEK